MALCQMDTINCEANWVMRETANGHCLWLNTTEVYNAKLKSMKANKKRRLKRSYGYDTRFKSSVARILESFERLPDANKINNLNLIVGFNTSDATFGFNGFNNALQMFFLDSDEIYLNSEHKVVLHPTMNPSVTFVEQVTKLLGKPFTSCNSEPDYTEQNCKIHAFMIKLLDRCNCYPR